MKHLEGEISSVIDDIIDKLSLSGYFEDNFIHEEWKYDNWELFIKIRWKNQEGYMQCTLNWDKTWHLDTIFSPGNGSFLLLALFYFASNYNISYITGNVRTNNEILNSQEQLENWYRKFGFEVTSRDSNGTKMKANIKNRPLAFRLETLLRKISWRAIDVVSTQSPPSASSHPQDPRSP